MAGRTLIKEGESTAAQVICRTRHLSSSAVSVSKRSIQTLSPESASRDNLPATGGRTSGLFPRGCMDRQACLGHRTVGSCHFPRFHAVTPKRFLSYASRGGKRGLEKVLILFRVLCGLPVHLTATLGGAQIPKHVRTVNTVVFSTGPETLPVSPDSCVQSQVALARASLFGSWQLFQL